MNKISPKKLLNSKWTAAVPINKNKHFVITEVEYDEDAIVISCVIEAVMSKSLTQICWRDLQNTDKWQQGWQ